MDFTALLGDHGYDTRREGRKAKGDMDEENDFISVHSSSGLCFRD